MNSLILEFLYFFLCIDLIIIQHVTGTLSLLPLGTPSQLHLNAIQASTYVRYDAVMN